MRRGEALLVHLLLGCLALCRCSSSLGQLQEQRGGPCEGAGPDRHAACSGATTGMQPGRHLLFDAQELHRMETLKAAEDHQLAVLDGRSKPLFSNNLLFRPAPVTRWFGSLEAGSAADPNNVVNPRRQQAQSQQQQQPKQQQALAQRHHRKQQQQQVAVAAGVTGGHRTGSISNARAPSLQSQQQHLAPVSAGVEQQHQQRHTAPALAHLPPTGGKAAPGSGSSGASSISLGAGSTSSSSKTLEAPDTATLALLLDSEAEEESIPEPELQFKDEGGTRILIWLPQDTLPRDLLLGKRPQVWLYCLLEADYEPAPLLPHFINHYMRLGIRPERMLFLVNHNPALSSGIGVGALANTTALLSSYGLDYRVWRGRYSNEAHLKHKLQVLSRVPVRDWIITADVDELHEYGGMTAPHFLAKCDAEGSSWVRGWVVDRVAADGSLPPVHAVAPALSKQFPLKCDITRKVANAEGTRVAAFKGYLRPRLFNDAVLSAGSARKYFGPAAPGDEAPRPGGLGGSCAATEDLLPLTPYHRYWKFYKAPDIQGNSYLWDAREAVDKASIHSFRWRLGVERSVTDRLQHWKEEDEACGGSGQPRFGAWQEAQRVADTILPKAAIDVHNPYLKCVMAEDMKMPLRRRQQAKHTQQADMAGVQ